MKNYYEILEVNQNASKEVIDKVYKILAKKYHPDTQEESKKAAAEELFKEISSAYEVLSNEEKRKEYDKQLEDITNSSINALKNENAQLKLHIQKLENQLTTVPNNTSNIYSSFNPLNYYKNAEKYYAPDNVTNNDYSKSYRKQFLIKKLKDLLAVVITIAIVISICFILWQIPFFRNYCIDIYSNNSLIKNLVDFILKFFE